MNERIKELLDQSGIKVKSDLSGFNLPEDINLYHAQGFDLEKFAELIVKECVDICDQQGRVGWNDDRKAQARLDRDLIKEHFGVE
jgi:hypothetical protein